MSIFLKGSSDQFYDNFGMEEYWNSDGTSPSDEEGVNISQDVEYLPAMKAEAKRFRDAILNFHPIPEGCRAELLIRKNPHDLGSYLDLVAFADPEDPEAVKWATELDNLPMTWKELEENTNALPPNLLEAEADSILR